MVFLVSLIEDRYPGRERREKIPLPAGILKEELPGDENFVQEERRLFYVGMTRAKRFLYLTWARDYGLKRLKKVSPFVLEALDIPCMPEEVLRRSALEEIRRFSLRKETGALSLRKPRGIADPELPPVGGLSHLPAQIQVPSYPANPRPPPSCPRVRQGASRVGPSFS